MEEAIIKTNRGDMKVKFFEKDAPNTVVNFTKLAKSGFYNGLTWHRVIPQLMRNVKKLNPIVKNAQQIRASVITK